MLKLQSCVPCPALRTFVRAFAQREVGRGALEVTEPMPASLEQIIDFQFGPHLCAFSNEKRLQTYNATVIGPSAYRPMNIQIYEGVENFAIFFQPQAIWRLFRIPMTVLVNNAYDSCDALDAGIGRLWHQMAETLSFERRVALVEKYLLAKAAQSLPKTPVMNAADLIVEQKGAVKIDRVAACTSLGLRQFERRFRNEVGLTPKLYARVARFQAVLDAKLTKIESSWLRFAHEYGYHDQMHMIREFQNLSGLTPECLLQRLGDIRPPALAAR